MFSVVSIEHNDKNNAFERTFFWVHTYTIYLYILTTSEMHLSDVSDDL